MKEWESHELTSATTLVCDAENGGYDRIWCCIELCKYFLFQMKGNIDRLDEDAITEIINQIASQQYHNQSIGHWNAYLSDNDGSIKKASKVFHAAHVFEDSFYRKTTGAQMRGRITSCGCWSSNVDIANRRCKQLFSYRQLERAINELINMGDRAASTAVITPENGTEALCIFVKQGAALAVDPCGYDTKRDIRHEGSAPALTTFVYDDSILPFIRSLYPTNGFHMVIFCEDSKQTPPPEIIAQPPAPTPPTIKTNVHDETKKNGFPSSSITKNKEPPPSPSKKSSSAPTAKTFGLSVLSRKRTSTRVSSKRSKKTKSNE